MKKFIPDFVRNKMFAAIMAASLVVFAGVPFTLATQTDMDTSAPDASEAVEVVNEPFVKGKTITAVDPSTGKEKTFSSDSYRIPSMVTLSDGTIVAAADIRWNTVYDGGGLDTLVARSTDGGVNWTYTLVNYLGDNGDKYNADSTCFIDPALTVGSDGTLYLLTDLYAYGVALNGNGRQIKPSTETGFDENGNLALTDGNGNSYCLKDGSIYPKSGANPVAGYSVDGHFNIYTVDAEGAKTYLSNLFFSDSPYKVARTGFLYLKKSTDGGATWSEPELLNLKTSSEQVCLVGPGRGITASDGTIAFPVYSYGGSQNSQRVGCVYSIDGGVTWSRSTSSISWGSEAAVVEVGQGTLRFFYRNGTARLCYVDFDLATKTWGSAVETDRAVNSNTQLSAITYSKTVDGKQVVLVSCPTGPNAAGSNNNDGSCRTNGRIFAGVVETDGTMTWNDGVPVNEYFAKSQLDGAGATYSAEEGFFAYSCLTELADGSVAVLYEDCQNGWGAGDGYYFTMDMKKFDPSDLDMGIAPSSLSGMAGDVSVTVKSESLPAGGKLKASLIEDVDAISSIEGYESFDASEYGLTNDDCTVIDASVMDGEKEWQPAEGEMAELTFESERLGLAEGDWYGVLHIHKNADGTLSVDNLGPFVSGTNKATFAVDGFSIYVVLNNPNYDGGDWNYDNYQITMTAGTSLQVKTTTDGNRYAWEFTNGDADSFSLSNASSQAPTVTANTVGEATLQCVITDRFNRTTTETMRVKALESVGDSTEDDIIFANIDKAYVSGDKEYENTYGPYVMKIRFEDTDGNVLKYADGATVGNDYYVFDSAVNIDINTFAAAAPDGYTYAGAFFYWAGHFDGAKVYVTNVDRSANEATGSYLWYSGTHSTNGSGRWAYQASGVLHVTYAPVDEVHTVIFKDHCGYELANYALPYSDRNQAASFPSGYVGNIQNMKDSLIPSHHASHDPGCEFNDSWVVTGGGRGIDGTYTTSQLKSNITKWAIASNVTITAQCTESDVTINYEVVGPDGSGSVDRASETLMVSSGNAEGSTATANENYTFVGWFKDAACTQPVDETVDANGKFVPAKVGGKNVAATYYAKFERAVADLTVRKVVNGTLTDGDTFLFKVYEMNGSTKTLISELVIAGRGSVVIKGLEMGKTYRVEEDTAWSWRYQASVADSDTTTEAGTITLGANANTVTFTNTKSDNNKWLDFSGWCKNLFNADGITASGFGFNAREI